VVFNLLAPFDYVADVGVFISLEDNCGSLVKAEGRKVVAKVLRCECNPE
jgi:hypothetical protein